MPIGVKGTRHFPKAARVASRLPRECCSRLAQRTAQHHIPLRNSTTANMLAIQSSTKERKPITPNILPCAIKHNGPVSADKRYWNPSTEQDGTSTSFFRGRKLRSKKLVLPVAYEGAILQKTDKKVVPKPRIPLPGAEDEMDEDNVPKDIETLVMEQQARFGEIMVWEHEAVPDGDDVYVKGIEEWIGFAEAVRSSYFSIDVISRG